MSRGKQTMSVHSCHSSPIQQQEQQQEELRGRQHIRFAPGTHFQRSARLRSPPPPPPLLSPQSKLDSDIETIVLPTHCVSLLLTSVSEDDFVTTPQVTPRSAPVSVPGVKREDFHPDGSAILWELTRFGEIPFVPRAIRPKRSLREITCAPTDHSWHHILGCWTIHNDFKTGVWGTPKPDTIKEKKKSKNYDSDCAVADDDENNEEEFTLVDPAKELERSHRRVFVEYRDMKGHRSIVFRQGERDKAIVAAHRYFLKGQRS